MDGIPAEESSKAGSGEILELSWFEGRYHDCPLRTSNVPKLGGRHVYSKFAV
jgi:hypothetical protein